ncbi:hypothetical protein VPDG_00096 [Vibrio phage henriette 12B8]|uniref:hypothetical protein n=1 Tax=Vibrio phage henriette 12B8 TaxID=573174 RepID=UPI0002C105AF|nr:hypothetical protein VPDG_00096 [Vibrio phage henriette 12B8]AGG58257.1 hypothetical protein VPDG_00096 [Vibrio phage henriette 12B8]
MQIVYNDATRWYRTCYEMRDRLNDIKALVETEAEKFHEKQSSVMREFNSSLPAECDYWSSKKKDTIPLTAVHASYYFEGCKLLRTELYEDYRGKLTCEVYSKECINIPEILRDIATEYDSVDLNVRGSDVIKIYIRSERFCPSKPLLEYIKLLDGVLETWCPTISQVSITKEEALEFEACKKFIDEIG